MGEAIRPIFFDPVGRRWPWFKRMGMIIGLYASLLGLVLSLTVLLLPASPRYALYRAALSLSLRHETQAEAEHKYVAWRTITKMRQLEREEEEQHRLSQRLAREGEPNQTVIGFYVNWDPNSYRSLQQHIDALSYVMPQWLSLSDGRDTFISQFSASAHDPDVIRLARHYQVPIIPILDNNGSNDLSWELLRSLLIDQPRQAELATQLHDYLIANHFAGINIDFELPYNRMTDAQLADARRLMPKALPRFIALLKKTFAEDHLLVTQDLPPQEKIYDYASLGELNDFIVIMFYDQHTPSDAPGPIASEVWIEQMADKIFSVVDSSKVVLGLGNYGYDWPINLDAHGTIVDADAGHDIQLGAAFSIARQVRANIRMDGDDLNPYYFYTDYNNHAHVVYLLDAVTSYNIVTALRGYEPRGAALWYLGSEDPSLWSFFDHTRLSKTISPDSLMRINYHTSLETDVDSTGNELTRVTAVSTPGYRSFDLDSDRLITGEHYRRYPTPFVVQQYGGLLPKQVALTFDDGPDPRYTPRILSILKAYHVPATFFIVGNQAAQYPDIVRRTWQEGNEIGNHTYTHPHIELISPWRMEMELNATQRLIEGLTGHMTLLFRPPYGDAPDSSSVATLDVPLLKQLQQDGYVNVGMNIDPSDFLRPGVGKIVHTIEQEVNGNHIILLHDSGGNREQTIQALPLIIRTLKARGYRFVTVSGLLGPGWHQRLFPKVTGRQEEIAGFDRFIFETWYLLMRTLHTLFILSIVLGVLRLLAMVPLAIRQHRRVQGTPELDNPPPVTVAIPAYNEAKVIVRTVQSVLASEYPDIHVIAVDDGSTDDTVAVLHQYFDDEPRVTIVEKENGGKATALNAAFALADTEIVVCMDADTIFTPQTIRHLMRQFADPQVGAVAGNVQVGNVSNLLTLWQSIEYTISQNFERLAYAALNSVPVIPGAVGAWHRDAVLRVGGFESNTLAEDADLTFKIRLLGLRTVADNDARAYTEAPEHLRALAKQRFRWSFGILQALWKHRRKLFNPRYGAFSCVVMPGMWIYNFLFQVLAPFVDIWLLLSLIHGQYFAMLYYIAIFFLVDAAVAIFAFRLDRQRSEQVVWLFGQRFFYREFLYYTIIQALLAAIRGGIVGWGKLDRKATVSLPSA